MPQSVLQPRSLALKRNLTVVVVVAVVQEEAISVVCCAAEISTDILLVLVS
jgi:hypothetical protein